MNIKQFICGIFGHNWSEWIPGINAKKDRRWCCKCAKVEERKVI
jgi:hypothetical protein